MGARSGLKPREALKQSGEQAAQALSREMPGTLLCRRWEHAEFWVAGFRVWRFGCRRLAFRDFFLFSPGAVHPNIDAHEYTIISEGPRKQAYCRTT